MTTCDACGTTIYLRDDGFLNAGTAGEMHDAPMLFALGDQVVIEEAKFQTIGHARFDYGPGWWDEFYALDGNGKGAWISVDEGEIILQRAVEEPLKGAPKTVPRLGQVLMINGYDYRVRERDEATCIALRGEFPETLTVGETYRFINARNQYADVLSGEFSADETHWFIGQWIDPFDIKVESHT
ncbi:DUF4178 domain-containing protein [Cognatiyoonia koreensis]|nr:DUF4178 domain-containing protein [Cognatiyoonia koreensis]